MEVEGRLPEHERIAALEDALKELNGLMLDAESLDTRPSPPVGAVVFIVGCARSGTTLLLQWLAASGKFEYPTNLMSRIYGSPRAGLLLQRILVDFDAKAEILPPEARTVPYTSELGKTSGASSPHEYWYWWRRFFLIDELQTLDDRALTPTVRQSFLRELGAFSRYGRPAAMKAMILNWHLPLLASLVPSSIFVHVRRDVASNAASLLDSRRRMYGNTARWYSFKPPQFPLLAVEPPEVQVVSQVLSTQAAVERGLSTVSADRCFTVDHSAFCQAPDDTWNELRWRLRLHDRDIGPYHGPKHFMRTDRPTPNWYETALSAAQRALRAT